MARLRNRILKADFWTDPDLLRWPRDKRFFYVGLRALAEDSGCIEDSPFGWMCVLYPSPIDRDITIEQVTQWRDELIAQGKLIRYTVGGKDYLYQTTFHEHEHPRNPQNPSLPLPPWVVWVESDKDPRRGRYEVVDSGVESSCHDRTAAVQEPNDSVTAAVQEPNDSVTAAVQEPNDSVTALPAPSRPVPSRPAPSRPELKNSLPDSCESAAKDPPKPVDKSPPNGNDGASVSTKLVAPRDGDWRQRAESILRETAFPDDYRRLAELMASENKTGKVAISRVVRELYEPLRQIEAECARDAMRAGLRAAITKGAPNANYVHKAAASYAARPAGAVSSGRVDALDVLQQVYDSCEVTP